MIKKCLILSLVFMSTLFMAFFEYADKARGFEEIQLTNDATNHLFPHWSKDGTWIYYYEDSIWNICRVRTDGSITETALVPDPYYVGPNIYEAAYAYFDLFESSPDTGWIAFTGGGSGTWPFDLGIHRMGLPSQSCNLLVPIRVVHCTTEYCPGDCFFDPAFSPDGQWIMYWKGFFYCCYYNFEWDLPGSRGGSSRPGCCWYSFGMCDATGDSSQIRKIRTDDCADGAVVGCSAVPDSEYCFYYYADWSPEGDWITYKKTNIWPSSVGFYKAASSGGYEMLLDQAGEYPSWSHDAEWIGYEKSDRIYRISTDGGPPRLLDNGRQPVWSPYTGLIAYDDLSYGICFIDTTGECKIRVAPLRLDQDRPPWITWSHDGASLAYNKLDAFGNYQIFLVNIFPESLFVDSLINVAALSVKANQFDLDCDSLRYTAKTNVRMGNEGGANYYFYLGDSSEAKIDSSRNTVYDVVPDTGSLGILSGGETFGVDSLTWLYVDAPSGQVDLIGDVQSPDTTLHESIFRGDCSLDLNGASLTGEIQLSDFRFAQLGFHAGQWDLNGCPFMGIQGELELATPVLLTELTLLDGDITLGVFVNTGVIRVGLSTAALEYREFGGAFGFDLSEKLGLPTQGTIDLKKDLSGNIHFINVVEDVPIGIPLPAKDSETTYLGQMGSALSLPAEKGEKAIVVDAGLTIKGEEDYTDLNCNGQHDPGEEYQDENQNGIWDQGTNIHLFNENLDPIFYLHGNAKLDLTLISYIHFTAAEALITVDYPTNNRMDFEIWTGLKLGNIFDLDLSTGGLHLDWRNHKYSGSATLANPLFPGLTFGADMDVTMNADTVIFIADFTTDFTIHGVNFLAGDVFLYLDQRGFYTTAYLDAFGLLTADGTFIIQRDFIRGSLIAEFSIDGWHFAEIQNRFYFAPGQCMSGAASVRLCLLKLCKTIPVSYRICSATNWSVNIPGLSISLGSPADLHIYDSQGRHTGINEEGGIDTEIPGSEFYVFEDIGQQLAFLPDPDLVGGFSIDVEGLADSVFDFNILYPNRVDGNAYNVGFFEEPTQEGALHRVNLDAGNNWTMQNDLDGDSIFESETDPDSAVEATLDTTMVTITNVSAQIDCGNSATITWLTSVPATGEVLYRSEHDSVYTSVSDTQLTTEHTVVVSGLLSTDTYSYIVVSVDTSGNIASFLQKTFKLEYLVGDANGDGNIDVADVTYLINYLFMGTSAPDPLELGDTNCDGEVDIADVIYLINYLFLGGSPPKC